jgi:hypothetical protein
VTAMGCGDSPDGASDCELATPGRVVSTAVNESKSIALQLFRSHGFLIHRRLCAPARTVRLMRHGINFSVCMNVVKDPLRAASPLLD